MIGVWICPTCSMPSIKYLDEKDSDIKVCPSCGCVMGRNDLEERLDKVEQEWIGKVRAYDL